MAVVGTERIAAIASAPSFNRAQPNTFRAVTNGRSARSEALLVAGTSRRRRHRVSSARPDPTPQFLALTMASLDRRPRVEPALDRTEAPRQSRVGPAGLAG
ncbi:hypothetical protein U1T56_23720 [Geminicoccaceae bacterium SYSU G07066]|uniref:Uncharacterized protein n=1 Tax=Benzoatithermus flavus TaxID=3108223 RepID=A0ABU8XY74_9PROT